uniref:non-specific serine/threonine protein kinase n=1 Tax=Leersia perrieri TaxID=77586 RepID=A0A0D9W202_9ORYZ
MSQLLPILLCMLLDTCHLIAGVATRPPPVSFSFNFSDPSSTYSLQDLQFDGDARNDPEKRLVDLSPAGTCAGCSAASRMAYAHPVQLYHQTSAGVFQVASFSTRFTFAIIPIDNGPRGDGMAFFLASYPSKLPPMSSGGNLGLITQGITTAIGEDRFIAVEFDTVNNSFDPKGGIDHISIDISSVSDPKWVVNTTILPSNLTMNGTMEAFVEFDSTTRMLNASLWLRDPSSSYAEVSAILPDPISSLLPQQVAVGFSAGTASKKELNQILSWSFNSTLAPLNKDGHHKAWLLGGLIVGVVVVLALVVWLLLACRKQKRLRNAFDRGTGGARRFEYSDLADATDNFSNDRKLGQGAFGVVYNGFLRRLGREVAVKKIYQKTFSCHKNFFSEISAISEAKHKNLVKFFGWCCRGYSWNISHLMCSCCWREKNKELFLVYELMKNGNLSDHLHKGEAAAVLSWPIRYKIAKGIGSGLFYLHHECDRYIVHRDIKPDNILLDGNFNAKIADFGLSRIADQDNATLQTNQAVGSTGYMDPQCMKDGQVRFNRSSDVYSFGIVLLEIACTGKIREQIWSMYRSRSESDDVVVEAADARLASTGGFNRREMERVIVLGLWCSCLEIEHRPSMQQAMDVLERDAPLPDLNMVVNSTLASAD